MNAKLPAIAALNEEHRVIALVTDAFERYIDRIDGDESIPREDLGRFVTFFREYADLGHHEKEEDILLRALATGGFDWEDQPIKLTRRDHRQERYMMRVLQQAALQAAEWSAEDRRHLVASARSFIEFQRRHMEHEEGELYPLVEKLASEDRQKLASELERFESERSDDGDTGWLRELADDLITTHGASDADQQGAEP